MTAGQGVFRGALSSGSTVSGDTSAAASFVGNAAPDHAYTITIPAGSSGAEYDIHTCGSGFGTYLRVFTDAGAEIASKDDGGCPGSLQQKLSVTLTAGTYTVVVDGYSHSQGAYSLTMSRGRFERNAYSTAPFCAGRCNRLGAEWDVLRRTTRGGRCWFGTSDQECIRTVA